METDRMNSYDAAYERAVRRLSDLSGMERKGFVHAYSMGDPMPSAEVLAEIIHLCRSVFFPGYYGKSSISEATLSHEIGVAVSRLGSLLEEQIAAGLCFSSEESGVDFVSAQYRKAHGIAGRIIERLPEIRSLLETDVIATYNGDPAAESVSQVISCYPAIRVMTVYRVAHELLLEGVPLIPRIMTELAHSETGIDIHPGATIGSYFAIDHGTGVVIGETARIGNHVKIYQGVTLGAKSFDLDEKGNPVKGVARHPIIEDNVIIYSNATILGRVTIGRGAVVGGNIWVTKSVEAGAQISQHKNKPD